MAKISTAEVRTYLKPFEGQELSLDEIRSICHIEKYGANSEITESYNYIRVILNQLQDSKIIRWLKRGVYKVVEPVQPVRVFVPDRTERPLFELTFPRNFDTMMEMDFANDVVIREGDIILVAGMSNFGKTLLCLNFCAENIDKFPVLMGNEYTVLLSDEEQEKQGKKYDVSPRFYNRVNAMSEWINWTNDDGSDKFTLLPVWADYAEHIVKDRINIIDWINLPGEYYMISPLMEKIKKAVGRGIGILPIQKAEGVGHGRGGAMTREFADLEILLDRLGDNETLLTIGKVKESRKSIVGKTYAFSSSGGVKIINFREVQKCPECKGTGYRAGKPCEECYGKKFIDKT